MREQSTFSAIVRYASCILGATAILAFLSFAFAGFSIRNTPLSLAAWGALCLAYGIWKLGMLGRGDAGISSVNDMRGQAGANPLAHYVNSQEYKLAKLRQRHIGEDEDATRETDITDEVKRLASDKQNGELAVCATVTGLLVLGLSWLAGRVFPR